MGGNDDERLRGVAMSAGEVDAFLTAQGTGVLSLADDGEAYGVPISFGYDGEALYFVLNRFGEESEKLAYADATEAASFATYTVEDEHRWRSVVVRGPLERVPEAEIEAADEVVFESGAFVSLYPHGEPTTERPRYRLAVESATGQQGQGYVE